MFSMVNIAIGLVVIGVILILLGVFVSAAKFLLWIGLIIAIVAVVMWLVGGASRRKV